MIVLQILDTKHIIIISKLPCYLRLSKYSKWSMRDQRFLLKQIHHRDLKDISEALEQYYIAQKI